MLDESVGVEIKSCHDFQVLLYLIEDLMFVEDDSP